MSNGQSTLLTIGQASKMLGVSEATLRQWTDEGQIEAFITPGGHRRYRETDLARFMGSKSRIHGIKDLVARIESTPEQEHEIAKTRFASTDWYRNLDSGSKKRFAELGKRIHELVITYISKPAKREETLQMARNIGMEFGEYLIQMDVSLTDAMEAFMMHRTPLVIAATDLMKKRQALNERAVEAIPLVTQMTDEVLLSLVATYHNRDRGKTK